MIKEILPKTQPNRSDTSILHLVSLILPKNVYTNSALGNGRWGVMCRRRGYIRDISIHPIGPVGGIIGIRTRHQKRPYSQNHRLEDPHILTIKRQRDSIRAAKLERDSSAKLKWRDGEIANKFDEKSTRSRVHYMVTNHRLPRLRH